jgi:dTDP-4-amino-4,6-dideoxygalactose transaminase
MPVLLPPEMRRQAAIDALRDRGIQTTVHYPPVHRLTFYNELYPDCRLENTEQFALRELTLPLHPQMSPADVEFVASSLAAALSEKAVVEAIG